MTTIDFEGARPQVPETAWVAPNATLVGQVTLCESSSVFYSSVLRGDMDSITIGPGSNIQDGCVVHTDTGFPAVVGAGVSVGHRAVLHGCTVEDDSLIGMGAVVLNGAVVGVERPGRRGRRGHRGHADPARLAGGRGAGEGAQGAGRGRPRGAAGERPRLRGPRLEAPGGDGGLRVTARPAPLASPDPRTPVAAVTR